MANKKSATSPRGRDARDGEFRTVDWAKKHPNISTVEQVPKPGKAPK